jgi:beta-lactamase class A
MTSALQFRLCLILALLIARSVQLQAQPSQESVPRESPARPEIEKLIKQSGADVSVAFRSLDGSQELFILADQPFEDPNALRIPVMVELYAQAEARTLKLTDTVPSLGSAGAASGPPVTLHDLCEEMILNNSDPATNRLIERLGIANIRSRIRSLGASGMDIGAPFPKSAENHASVRSVLTVLWALAAGKAVGSDATNEMVDLLSHSTLHASANFVPSSATDKTAAAPVVHDAVIIFGAHSFVFVIQVRGLADPSAGAALLAKITKILANAT